MRRYLFPALFLLVTLVSGKNMWEIHGHNFSYSPYGSAGERTVVFPVAWDVRSANNLLNSWKEASTLLLCGQNLQTSGFPSSPVRMETSFFRLPAV